MGENVEKRKRPQIRIGFRFGRLTVISDTGDRKNGYNVWKCSCDCGGIIQLDTRTLQRGSVQDCGCLSKVKSNQRDLTGQRFGKLVALEPTQERSSKGDTIWKCHCDCGNDALVPLTQLTQGNKKSCGCMGHPPIKDYIGKRFGQLVVIRYFGKCNGMHRWECQCDCGNTTVVGQTLLQSGKTKSCGCLQAKIVIDNMKFIDGTSVTLLEKASGRHLSTNTSGYNGVYLNRRSGKWIAQIGFKGKTYYLGSFRVIEDAVKARREAEQRIYGEFLDWYYQTYSERKCIMKE